eukprot:977772-Rhodomonas_salina.1
MMQATLGPFLQTTRPDASAGLHATYANQRKPLASMHSPPGRGGSCGNGRSIPSTLQGLRPLECSRLQRRSHILLVAVACR